MCFSLINYESFDSIRNKWFNEIKNSYLNQNIPIVLVSTKFDLINKDDPTNLKHIQRKVIHDCKYLKRKVKASHYFEFEQNNDTQTKFIMNKTIQIALLYNKRKLNEQNEFEKNKNFKVELQKKNIISKCFKC
jgi:GTPase SAR1 family protein